MEEKINTIIKQLKDFDGVPFQWFASFHSKSNLALIRNPEKHLGIWCKEVAKLLKVQVAHMGILIREPNNNIHMHVLMCGKNRFNETLHGKDHIECELIWNKRYKAGRKGCKIVPVIYDQGNLFKYLACYKNMAGNDYEILFPRNLRLINKLKRLKQDKLS